MKENKLDRTIKLTLVIVDDSPSEHTLIKNAMKDFTNVLFNDYYRGEDFIRFLEEKAKKRQTYLFPDIVILNVNMPNLSGFEIFKTIENRGLKDHMRFYVLSDNITDDEIKNCDQYQLKCYKKPFNIEHFEQVLAEIINDYAKR